jgi:aminoglycoside phosphotransferase (APT) family kinase protein
VESALSDFSQAFGEVIDAQLWQITLDRLALLGDLPLVCEQRDFSPWNVLVANDGTLVILDWESAELHGLPALDLIYFSTYLAFFHDGAMQSGRYRESYRAALDRTTATGAVMAECLARYADGVGISHAALPSLRLLAWLIHARSEYQRLVADAGQRPKRAALGKSLFLSLWEEEIHHAVQA